MIIHPIPPQYDENSRILILGSFPSIKSRECGFYYGHPQNRFWKVLSNIFEDVFPKSIEEKKTFLKRHGIALWDVIESCEIEGSADSTIKDVRVNDIGIILKVSPIKNIFVNGKTAEKYYNKYAKPTLSRKCIVLPSTSPANAVWTLEKLISAWRVIKE